jgi:hypothetical protein
MTAIPNIAPDAHTGAEAAGPAAAAPLTGPFVLNLCSSTTPMALAQTDLPELKRFTFVVSRRFEEGRERFRLHMGYFATLAEAEEWLALVREIYPGAWAGEAPGRKLRERAAAAAAAQAQHAAGPQQRVAPPAAHMAASAAVTPVPAHTHTRTDSVPVNVPVVHAAAVQRAAAPVVHAAPPVAPTPAPRPSAPPATAAAPAAPPRTAPNPPPPASATAPKAPARVAPAAAQPAVTRTPQARPATSAAATSPPPSLPAPLPVRKGVFEDSNVREVLAALGDTSATGQTRQMRTPPPRTAPPQPAAGGGLSDTQVLTLLEARVAEGAPQAGEIPGSGIPFLKPDDTATRRALQEAVANNAPVAFAVQLQWSVQPAEIDKVPPLAIFSAYTLYTVEGSREGRKWYGLRLGFFSDAISAKQVAYYVRSEFTSVAVVPVSPEERIRATEQDRKAAQVASPGQSLGYDPDEFKLLDDDAARFVLPSGPPPAVAPGRPGAKPAAKAAAKVQPKVAVGRVVRQSHSAAGARSAGKVGARERKGAQTLEETLEILGASALSIDNGKGETLNDSGVRHLRIDKKNSPFARLLERLSERVKKP